jgi:hypothetical protein
MSILLKKGEMSVGPGKDTRLKMKMEQAISLNCRRRQKIYKKN